MTDPQIIERACGGWLARAPAGAPVRIAVVGDDEAAARASLQTELAEWERLLEAARVRRNADG